MKTKMDLSGTGLRPTVIEQIIQHAKTYGINEVILFGSRARGDYRRESDIDLAVSGGNEDLFRLAVEENTDTLLKYDVVNLDHTANELLIARIQKDGLCLYDRQAT